MSTSPEIVRVLRLLEYVGERTWVEDTLERSGVPLNGTSPNWGRNCSGYIRSGMIGNFPEVVQNVFATHPDYNAIENVKFMLQQKFDYYKQNQLSLNEMQLIQEILEYVEEAQKQFNLLGELKNVEENSEKISKETCGCNPV